MSKILKNLGWFLFDCIVITIYVSYFRNIFMQLLVITSEESVFKCIYFIFLFMLLGTLFQRLMRWIVTSIIKVCCKEKKC